MELKKAKLVLEGMKAAGMDFATGVPDAQVQEVYKMAAADPEIRYVGAVNEGDI